VRFPGKVLEMLAGKPVVQWVYERAQSATDDMVVATDSEKVAEAVRGFGGNVVLTDGKHESGTDRCCEALDLYASEADYVINIQGDEPFIEAAQLQKIISLLDGSTEIATLISPVHELSMLEDVSEAKVVLNVRSEAIYFSRSVIPFVRNFPKEEWLNHVQFYRHLGVYAYRSDILRKISLLPPSSLELSEKLEQLRWIENGFKIKTTLSEFECIGIDTPEDLQKAKEYLAKGIYVL
jgi:3-deoxy-manno-octulosonate cytidylyltransferase (CMP-KDO synthetase)